MDDRMRVVVKLVVQVNPEPGELGILASIFFKRAAPVELEFILAFFKGGQMVFGSAPVCFSVTLKSLKPSAYDAICHGHEWIMLGLF
jgi:hypothetical protein